MVSSLKNTCVSFSHFLIDPYVCGVNSFKIAANSDKKIQSIIDAKEIEPENRSLKNRVTLIIIGSILLIPVINYLVLAILKIVNKSSETKGTGSEEIKPKRGIPPSPEELRTRREKAIATLKEFSGLELKDFKIADRCFIFNLDNEFADYSVYYNSNDLISFFYCRGVQRGSLVNFTNRANEYDHADMHNISDRKGVIRKYLSQLYDCLRKYEIEKGETPELNQFVQLVAQRLQDAHRNCDDQVLGQLEDIMLDALEFVSKDDSDDNPMIRRAAIAIQRYKIRKLKEIYNEICLRDRSRQHNHQADEFRILQQRIVSEMGVEGAVYNADAVLSQGGTDLTEKNIEDIKLNFLHQFTPLNFLVDNLTTVWTVEKKFRAELLLDITEYLDLGSMESNAQVEEIIQLITAPKHRADQDNCDAVIMGGNMSQEGVLFLLELHGVISRTAP